MAPKLYFKGRLLYYIKVVVSTLGKKKNRQKSLQNKYLQFALEMAAKLKYEDKTTSNTNGYAPEYIGEPQNPSQDNLVRFSGLLSSSQANLSNGYQDGIQALSLNQQYLHSVLANSGSSLVPYEQPLQSFPNELNQNYYISRSNYEGNYDSVLAHMGHPSSTSFRQSPSSFSQPVPPVPPPPLQQHQQYQQQYLLQLHQQQFQQLQQLQLLQLQLQLQYYQLEHLNVFNMHTSSDRSNPLILSHQQGEPQKGNQVSSSFSGNSSILQNPERTHRRSSETKSGSLPKKPRIATTFWENENTICYQVEYKNIVISRRQDSNYINATKLLNATGISRGKRDGILKAEKTKEVVKVGSMKLKGVWLPFERAAEFARNEGFDEVLYPLFVRDIKKYLRNTGNDSKSWDPLASPPLGED